MGDWLNISKPNKVHKTNTLDKIIQELHYDCKCDDPYLKEIPFFENGKEGIYEDELKCNNVVIGNSYCNYNITTTCDILTDFYLILENIDDIHNIESISFDANTTILFNIDLNYIINCEKEKIINCENRVKILIFDSYIFKCAIPYSQLIINVKKKMETNISISRKGMLLCNHILKKILQKNWSIPITLGSTIHNEFIHADKLILLDYYGVKSLTIKHSDSNVYKYILPDYNLVLKEFLLIDGLCDIISEYIKDRIEINYDDLIDNIMDVKLEQNIKGTFIIEEKYSKHIKKGYSFYQIITKQLIIKHGGCKMDENQ